MLPSMPLLMTPIKKEISQNEDDQHTDNRTPMPTQTKNIFVDVMETEQCQPCMDESHNKKEINQSPFSPPSIEVQNISNKKIISPRQSKITRQRVIDTMAKENEGVNHHTLYLNESSESPVEESIIVDFPLVELGKLPPGPSSSAIPSSQQETPKTRKRKQEESSDLLLRTISSVLLWEKVPRKESKDEFTVFGEYVANELRSCKGQKCRKVLADAKRKINVILGELELQRIEIEDTLEAI